MAGRNRLPGSDNPYVLYGASNAASLLALAAYPVLIEPALGLARQALFWAVGYAVYVALALMCAVRAWRTSASFKDDGEPAVAEADEPPPARRLHWIALAAAPVEPDARRDLAPHR
jgi:hypothetical protein